MNGRSVGVRNFKSSRICTYNGFKSWSQFLIL